MADPFPLTTRESPRFPQAQTSCDKVLDSLLRPRALVMTAVVGNDHPLRRVSGQPSGSAACCEPPSTDVRGRSPRRSSSHVGLNARALGRRGRGCSGVRLAALRTGDFSRALPPPRAVTASLRLVCRSLRGKGISELRMSSSTSGLLGWRLLVASSQHVVTHGARVCWVRARQ